MSRNSKTFNFVLTGLFIALIYVVTAYFPRIPTARGYIHIGDAVIYLAASMLPEPFSAAAAGVGGMLADLLTGYAIWAPYTLVIKALLTLAFTSKKGALLCRRNILATIIAFPITIGGYYV
ncbi:MAG: ECF transporter S component, partial [Synergistaceae bacterium]|nr:ECF transporter S component [Synergistaceae bacterium]